MCVLLYSTVRCSFAFNAALSAPAQPARTARLPRALKPGVGGQPLVDHNYTIRTLVPPTLNLLLLSLFQFVATPNDISFVSPSFSIRLSDK